MEVGWFDSGVSYRNATVKNVEKLEGWSFCAHLTLHIILIVSYRLHLPSLCSARLSQNGLMHHDSGQYIQATRGRKPNFYLVRLATNTTLLALRPQYGPE
jgi:hypothetical protein